MKEKEQHSRNSLRKRPDKEMLLQRYETDVHLNQLLQKNALRTVDIRRSEVFKEVSSSLRSYDEASKPTLRRYRLHKEENDELAQHLTYLKKLTEFHHKKPHFSQFPEDSYSAYGLVEIIKQYQRKRAKIPKLSMDENNLFKVEPLLEEHPKRIDENIVLHPHSVHKARIYLKKLNKSVNKAIDNAQRKCKGLPFKVNKRSQHLRIYTEEDNDVYDGSSPESNEQLLRDIQVLLKMIKEEKLNSYLEANKKQAKTQSSFSDKNLWNVLKNKPKISFNNMTSLLRSQTPHHSQIKSNYKKYEDQINPLKNKGSLNNNITNTNVSTSTIKITPMSKSMSKFSKKSKAKPINCDQSPTYSNDFKVNFQYEEAEDTPKNKNLFNRTHQNSTLTTSATTNENAPLPLGYCHLIQNYPIRSNDILNTYLQSNRHLTDKETNSKLLYKQIKALQFQVKNKDISEKIKKIYNDSHKLNYISDKVAKLTHTERNLLKLNNVYIQSILSKK